MLPSMIVADTDHKPLPNWRGLAQEQLAVPGTRAYIAELTGKLNHSYRAFGPKILDRLNSCAFFGTTTFQPAERVYFAQDNAYVIAWVFALDNLLDSCSSFDYASDLQKLLNHRLALPLSASFSWSDLPLATDVLAPLPGLPYSLLMLVEQLQALRCSLAKRSSDPDGLSIFDQVITEQVVPAMLWETKWRLKLAPEPSFDQYIAQGYLSICGNLCTSIVNALLPNAMENWLAIYPAMVAMCYACRLINDGFTWPKERAEGKPNALGLLIQQWGEQEAQLKMDTMVDDYSQQLVHLYHPDLVMDKTDPLYTLSYYVYHVLVITKVMYSHLDFSYSEVD